MGATLVNDNTGADAFVAKLGGATSSTLWARRVGVSGNFLPGDVAVVPPTDEGMAGDVVVVGTFDGTLVCSGPSCIGAYIESDTPEAFVQRIAADGPTVRWTRTAGGPSSDAADAVAIGTDGAIVVAGRVTGGAKFDMHDLGTSGPNDGNAFVAKLTKDGEPLWAYDPGDSKSQAAVGVAVSEQGEIAVVGSMLGVLDFGGGASLETLSNQAFVAKLTGDGDGVWARGYPGDGVVYPSAVVFDEDGNIVAAGYFQGTIDFGGKSPVTTGQSMHSS